MLLSGKMREDFGFGKKVGSETPCLRRCEALEVRGEEISGTVFEYMLASSQQVRPLEKAQMAHKVN